MISFTVSSGQVFIENQLFIASCEEGCHRFACRTLEAALAAAPSLQIDCGDEPWLNLPDSQVGHD